MPFSSLHFPFLSRFTSSPPPSLSPTAEVQASFLSRVFFHWISPLIIRGSRQPLQQSDLPELAENDQSATIAPVFAHAYRLVTAADIRRQLSSQNQSDLIQCANSASCLSAAYPSGHHHPHVSNENAHVRAPRLSRLAELCPPAIFHSKTLRALIPVSFAPFLRAAAIKPLWLAASIAQAFCIRALVERVTQSSESDANLSSRWAFVPVVLALTFAAEVMSVTSHAVFSGSMRGGMRARAALSSQIYRKTLRLSPFSLSQVSEGEIGNLLVNDTQRVLDSYTYAHFCWMGFFEIAVISVLLIIDLGLSALFGVAVLVLLVPAQISFSALVGRARAKVSVEADKRVQTMNELLSGIRTVKLSAWEPHFMNVISEQRAQEMRHLRFGAVLRALNAALFFVAPVLVALGTFTARTLIFQEPLTPAVVFSTLAFFNTLAYVLNLMPIGWLSISEALVAGKRLDAFFDLSELPPTSKIGCSDPSEAGKREEADDTELSETSSHMESLSNSQDISSEDQSCHSKSLDKNRLILRHAHFSFAQRQESNAQAVALTNISLTVADGELVCVVGPVGSGKSSLLLGILNELVCTSGFVQKHGRVAYCAQQPWIVNGTLRDNITMFGPRDKVFDSAWYGMVVEACCLKDDLDMLPASDLTEIGERGVNLSGGQKARISLARAVYSNAEIYILDDPLSAVDSAVTSHLIQSLFAQNGLLAEKAKVVVTHQLKLLPLSTRVVVLREGTVHHSGTFKELQNEGIEFSGLAELDSNLHGGPDCFQEREEINGSRALQKSRDCRIERSERGCKAAVEISDTTESIGAVNGTLELRTSIDDSDSVDKMMFSVNTDTDWSSREKTFEDNGELVEEEDRCIGRVTSSVYKVYIKAGGGYVALVMVLTAFIVPQALRQVSEWWLSRWSVHSRSNTFWEVNRFHALIFLGLAVGTAVLTLLRAAIFARQTMVASKRMHNQLLGRVLRAQPSFFETNPLGRILNRFSKDIDNMDIMLPVTTQDCLQIFFVALGALMTISVILPEFLIPLVPIIGTFLALQRLYKMTSRELKRIDGVSRSPIYSQFVESAGGLATIRAYKHETRFCTRFNEHVDKNSSAYHMFACAGRWLGIRLDALAAGVVLCTGLVVLILSQHLNPGLAGVALTQSLLITGIFQWGVRQAAETENLFTSVERVSSMSRKTPVEKPYNIPDKKPPSSWPSEGRIVFDNVELRYRPELDPALRNLSFATNAAERIGIVGRTGSGKSSVVTSLFRMVEISKGSISIDGFNSSEMGLHDLRSNVAIVPQDPVLFKGTIRSNLDPSGSHNDFQLWDAIHRVHMSSVLRGTSEDIDGRGCGLDMTVHEKGSNFSVGERQLFSLARVILSGVKVVVLDEASASLDNHTDMLVQKTVREHLSDRTIFTIAHRLVTVADNDRIMVMDAGELVEFDSPSNLLGQRGYFSKLVAESGRTESAIIRTIVKNSSGGRKTQAGS